MITTKLNIPGEGAVELELLKAEYANGRLAIVVEEVESREPWCVLTVNMPEDHLDDGEFFIKTWSENADTTTALMSQTNLFENTGRIVKAGYANACVWKFKDAKTLDQMRKHGR